MSRTFKTVDYEATLDQTVRLGDCLPPDHLARFIVDVIAQLDLSAISARYRPRGGAPYAPELLFGLLAYGYATGVFSSRKLERATYESAPFRFIAGNLHPDHDTIATFRTSFLPDLQDLFVQVLLLAQAMGVLKVGNISIDGTKIHADASKSNAVSYKRLLDLEAHLRAEVQALFALAAHADQGSVPDGMVVATEIALREGRLARLAEAKAMLEARAKEREAIEQAESEAKVREREAKAQRTGKPPRGKPPTPPTPGPRDDDQYNFPDPESRIMKNSTDKGFNQHYNAQIAVEQECLLIVGTSLSNHPNDQAEVMPTVATIPVSANKLRVKFSRSTCDSITELNKEPTMSHIRVLVCRVDDPTSDQMTELAAFDLPAPDPATLQPDTTLDNLETVTHETGNAILRRVLQAQWETLDTTLTEQYRQRFSP